ncbi:hypothetical protein [Actinomyces sp. ICM47]|jgi:hypothetical protein|uniref:hypothetical protein n=1 Tax=Actinomyces sp. ICM47 TaxID=936548 RepID=UPI0025B9A15E|nr:hypothetical protein [Actinomyces sp. ICM47]
MKKGRKTRRTWSKRLPAMSVLLVSAILYAIAFMSRGMEVTQVSVNDGGIWVTNQDRKLVGHLNYDARMLDGRVSVKSASFDIGQAGGDVTLGEAGTRTVSPVPWFARVRCALSIKSLRWHCRARRLATSRQRRSLLSRVTRRWRRKR